MSESEHPPATKAGVMVAISERLIRVLPPAFIALLLVNILFIGLVAWVFDHAAENRNVLLTQIVESCLVKH